MNKNFSLFDIPRASKTIIAVVVDSMLIGIAFFAALAARWDDVSVIYDPAHWYIFSLVLSVSLLVLIRLGLYRSMLRYLNNQVFWSITLAAMVALFATISFSFYLKIMIPRTVPFIFAGFFILLVGGIRMIARAFLAEKSLREKQTVIIYGAGAAGRQLATALTHGLENSVAGFIDDDENKRDTIIQGIKVYSREELPQLIEKRDVHHVLLALPSISNDERRNVLNFLEPLPIKVLTIPAISDLVNGNAALEQFKEVEIDDLLGRNPVLPKPELMAKNIKDKVVLVSGAGGSIGSELCRQIIKQQPAQLLLFELNEFSLYAIDTELKSLGLDNVEVISLIGSVQDKRRVESILSTFSIDTIYHAAAYKHVPIVEHNVTQGVRNNVFGTLAMATSAVKHKVATFVLISTDKAVRPTNVMGATKRMAELTLQALAKQKSDTTFCMVRFGNVLGSSGSVVPLFRKQIRSGGPVTITHMDITRYFMTIPEASQLVIQAGAMAKGGDVFVLDMGESVKIVDLAKKMIRFSGLEVKDHNNINGDIEIKCTGLRPGEKLYEELLIGDNVAGTSHERIMTAQEVMLPWPVLEELLDRLNEACRDSDQIMIRHLLLEAPTAFKPTDEICDLVWGQKNRELERELALSLEASKAFDEKPKGFHSEQAG
ncbi:polysaccharide biosynthesis protein [Psychrosphaera haliotis]|uniref:NAD-dependent epimerase/dehydratase family protein n=1 Tax=Psychrosphaera haliotis TaxID=555083 RepID=A0A6N8F909_9GAMM|nr:nucleoside-diphosphate sugar epimerase/dehydratase [Psychrosphaera haliotis]MUH71332.1 NAD-dependent epimerase/dehydratase family protein [Psychrosphaera haliotis]